MTAGQFFLGLVTIFVATFVYRWQKTIDRKSQLAVELRSAYALYLKAENALFQTANSVKDRARSTEEQAKVDAAFSEMLHCLKVIEIFAPSNIVDRCQRHQSALHYLVMHWLLEDESHPDPSEQKKYLEEKHKNRIRYREAYFTELDDLTKEMRSDVEQHGGFAPIAFLRQLPNIWKRE